MNLFRELRRGPFSASRAIEAFFLLFMGTSGSRIDAVRSTLAKRTFLNPNRIGEFFSGKHSYHKGTTFELNEVGAILQVLWEIQLENWYLQCGAKPRVPRHADLMVPPATLIAMDDAYRNPNSPIGDKEAAERYDWLIKVITRKNYTALPSSAFEPIRDQSSHHAIEISLIRRNNLQQEAVKAIRAPDSNILVITGAHGFEKLELLDSMQSGLELANYVIVAIRPSSDDLNWRSIAGLLVSQFTGVDIPRNTKLEIIEGWIEQIAEVANILVAIDGVTGKEVLTELLGDRVSKKLKFLIVTAPDFPASELSDPIRVIQVPALSYSEALLQFERVHGSSIKEEAVFRAAIDQCCELLDWDLQNVAVAAHASKEIGILEVVNLLQQSQIPLPYPLTLVDSRVLDAAKALNHSSFTLIDVMLGNKSFRCSEGDLRKALETMPRGELHRVLESLKNHGLISNASSPRNDTWELSTALRRQLIQWDVEVQDRDLEEFRRLDVVDGIGYFKIRLLLQRARNEARRHYIRRLLNSIAIPAGGYLCIELVVSLGDWFYSTGIRSTALFISLLGLIGCIGVFILIRSIPEYLNALKFGRKVINLSQTSPL